MSKRPVKWLEPGHGRSPVVSTQVSTPKCTVPIDVSRERQRLHQMLSLSNPHQCINIVIESKELVLRYYGNIAEIENLGSASAARAVPGFQERWDWLPYWFKWGWDWLPYWFVKMKLQYIRESTGFVRVASDLVLLLVWSRGT